MSQFYQKSDMFEHVCKPTASNVCTNVGDFSRLQRVRAHIVKKGPKFGPKVGPTKNTWCINKISILLLSYSGFHYFLQIFQSFHTKYRG